MSTTLRGAISVERLIDGRFPLLQELGRTEWSSAYLTELDDREWQKAAIKIFPFETVDASATIARWEAAETLSHPHLMPLFHAGRCEFEGEDLLYVVTEYADETLSQILPERPLSAEEAREMLGPVLGALAYLHGRGLTHGHLRPTNVMVVNDQLKLSPDFGWCSRTRTIYDPPEAGDENMGAAADIWSLGILLVEALTQQPPAWDRSQGGEPEIPANLPEPFFTICRECLRTDPERRCSLADIDGRLHPAPVAEPVMPPAEAAVESTAESVAKRSYKLRLLILTGALLVLLMTFGAFKFGWDSTPTSSAPEQEPLVQAPPSAPETPAATASKGSTTPTVEPATIPAQASTPAPASGSPAGGIVRGTVVHQALPDIPTKILGAIQGHVEVGIRVEVDANGDVSRASIESAGPSRYFANQALHAAQNWNFVPARVNGSAAASSWRLQFQFESSQTAVRQTEETP